MAYLLKFDAPGIHSYIFGEDVLKQVRGASALVDYLSRDFAKDQILEGKVVYLGGGGGAVLFADQAQGEAFGKALANAYRQQAPGLAFKYAGCDYEPQTKLFEVMQRLDAKLKQSDIDGNLGCVLPGYLMPCSSCRQQPAVEAVYQHRLCANCLAKYRFLGKHSDQERAFLKAFEAFIGDFKGEKGDAWRTVLAYMQQASQATAMDSEARDRTAWESVLPATLMDIGELAARSGYFAMVYADGNRMGNAIQSFLEQGTGSGEAEAETYCAFSQKLVQAMEQATFNALIETIPLAALKLPGRSQAVVTPLREHISEQEWDQNSQEPETRYILPFEILLLGGDDLVLMLQPELALPFSLALQKHFKQAVKAHFAAHQNAELNKLSLGVGMVIAPSTTPIRRLFANAEALLNSAKRKAFEMEKDLANYDGALDWLTLVSDSNHDLETYRRDHFEVFEAELSHHARLTQRPLSYTEGLKFQQLAEQVLATKELPLGPLQALVESCRESLQKGNVNLLYLLGRLDERSRGALSWLINSLDPAEAKLGALPSDWECERLRGNEKLLPFYQPNTGQPPQTGLLDLHELLPFYATREEVQV